MKVVEPGHIYELNALDGDGTPHLFIFVNREAGDQHPGIQTQEVLRMEIDMLDVLMDRTNHCDGCMPWEGNARIVKHMAEAQRQMRLAILEHEHRANQRHMDKDGIMPEKIALGPDGHFKHG